VWWEEKIDLLKSRGASQKEGGMPTSPSSLHLTFNMIMERAGNSLLTQNWTQNKQWLITRDTLSLHDMCQARRHRRMAAKGIQWGPLHNEESLSGTNLGLEHHVHLGAHGWAHPRTWYSAHLQCIHGLRHHMLWLGEGEIFRSLFSNGRCLVFDSLLLPSNGL
jgi:hypothetical protein